ncbi:MAG: threonine aldolase family protein [Gemmatimonadetes bacterium]|nr:threonine aldolase family protein [Gemmatimonadota bacterium]
MASLHAAVRRQKSPPADPAAGIARILTSGRRRVDAAANARLRHRAPRLRFAPVIDLRSDTVTRPTPAMREAIARAEVGDDALGDDPTVARLQARVAELLGKESALFFPSGVMANEAALLVLAPPATEVVVEANCHLVDWEDGAPAQWAGVQLRPVATPDGMLTPELVSLAIRPASRYQIRTSLICLENTHNAAGGRILSPDAMRAIRQVAGQHGLPVYLDGSRLWNASAASGVPEAEYAAQADLLMVTLSKGLGCPAGSLLAGPAELIERAWRVRRRLGGGMRQVGLLAAAGLYALEHHRARLHQDHERARLLGRLAGELPGIRVVPPETNIVMLDLLREKPEAGSIVERLREHGVLLTAFTSRRLRAVTHLDVDDAAVHAAAAALREVLQAS